MSGAVRLPGRGGWFARRLPTFVLSLLAVELWLWWGVTLAPPEVPQALSDIPLVVSLPAAFLMSWRLVAFVVGYVVGALLSIVPHELGHLVAARLLGLPVLGVAFGRLTFGRTSPRPGVAAHVRVDLGRAPGTGLPARMVVLALCGPAGGLVFAGAVALAAADAELPLPVRLALGGAVASAAVVQLASVVPTATRGGDLSDGAAAVRWAFRPERQLERVALARDVHAFAAEVSPGATGDAGLSDDDFERLRAALGDTRHPIATVAAHRLQVWLIDAAVRQSEDPERPRDEFAHRARTLAPDVVRYASRPQPPLDERHSIVVKLTFFLARLLLRERSGEPIDPESPELTALAPLAELGWRLRPEDQRSRNQLALVRYLQRRPADARALLLNTADDRPTADQQLLSDADAIRGLAECALGDVGQAQRLLAAARRRGPESEYVGWLEFAIRRRVESSRAPEPTPSEA